MSDSPSGTPRLTRRPEWTALEDHRKDAPQPGLRELFAADPGRGARRARQDGRLRGPGALRRVDRPHRQADPQRRQHRHRRLRPRPGDGLRGAAAVHRPGADVPVRVERGRLRPPRGGARPGPGGDAVHRGVQDLHHDRDGHQRHVRALLAAGGAGGRRKGGGEALRRPVDQRGEGRRVRHRRRQHVRVLGLGRRPLLVRLRDRPVPDDRDRPPRRPVARGAALQPLPVQVHRLPPAARHGVQRQVG